MKNLILTMALMLSLAAHAQQRDPNAVSTVNLGSWPRVQICACDTVIALETIGTFSRPEIRELMRLAERSQAAYEKLDEKQGLRERRDSLMGALVEARKLYDSLITQDMRALIAKNVPISGQTRLAFNEMQNIEKALLEATAISDLNNYSYMCRLYAFKATVNELKAFLCTYKSVESLCRTGSLTWDDQPIVKGYMLRENPFNDLAPMRAGW